MFNEKEPEAGGSSNFFSKYDWNTMMSINPWPENPVREYDIKKYHSILCPEHPDFLEKYLALPSLKRLEGIGLLCGTDWTRLYKNRFYYSRLDHSLGVALIIWNFTHNKAQTLAGLFHDISTPVFSHVSDFRKGDALTQTATENDTKSIIHSDKELASLLAQDGLTPDQIDDYHLYPVADNEIPRLSADRLEYMFPSGMALDGSWNLSLIEKLYKDIIILKNEDGLDELGFNSPELALDYCRHFCMIGHILQLNENKLTLQMLGQIMNMAVEAGLLQENDFMTKSEKEIMAILEQESEKRNPELRRFYKTFRSMTKIEHTNSALPEQDYYSVSLNVKQRYINPLVKGLGRLSEVSTEAAGIIQDFKTYKDTEYGCVKLI